jgi:peptide chain release factor 1
MFEKLDHIETKYKELTDALASPEVMSDSSKYQKTAKAHSEISEIYEKYREYKDLKQGIEDSTQMLATETDAELREYAQQELTQLQERIVRVEENLKLLLVPKDPNDERNVILEIRAGTGGDEASLFAADLFRMYTRYAETQHWKVELLSTSESGAGGFKEVIAMIEGKGVYSKLKYEGGVHRVQKLKYEGGVHRVQRVPATETQGRIHTSTVTVAVMPEAEEVDIKIEAKDLRIDTFCSSGPGGQSVNTTYSAVRITHIPTNTVVSCQDEKSQIKNREKGMRVLRARLYEIEQEKQQEALSKERKSMVGSGDRSEKIRTYNFKENRVSDHRIGLTLYQLADVMEGKLQPFVDALTTHYNAEKLKNYGEGGQAAIA